MLICPETYGQETRPTYAMNGSLKNAAISTIASPEKTVTLFDSIPGIDLAGGKELFPDPPRHTGGQIIGFVDGHVKFIHVPQYLDLIWIPTITQNTESSTTH